MRDERTMVATVLQRAGLQHRFVDDAVARFVAASPTVPDGAVFLVDAPPGWLRISTTMAGDPSDPAGDATPARTGFGAVHWDERLPGWRASVQLLAADQPPLGSAVIAAVQHLLGLRAGLRGAGASPESYDDPPPECPTFPDSVLALGQALALRWRPDGAFVGEIPDETGALLPALAFLPRPGVFAFEVVLGAAPPSADVQRACAQHLTAGLISANSQGQAVFGWACPLVWLDVGELRRPTLVEAALEAARALRLATRTRA